MTNATNATNPIEAAFEMQRQSIKYGERLFEQSLDMQRNGTEMFLENSLAVQRDAQQQQWYELVKQMFDAQFEAFQSAFDDDAVRAAVIRHFETFKTSQSDTWDAFEEDFHQVVDDLSAQQREAATQSVQAVLSAQKAIEEQTIESVHQT